MNERVSFHLKEAYQTASKNDAIKTVRTADDVITTRSYGSRRRRWQRELKNSRQRSRSCRSAAGRPNRLNSTDSFIVQINIHIGTGT